MSKEARTINEEATTRSFRKKKLGSKPYLYPMPTVLVGANVAGKANFETIAFCGVLEQQPALIGISSGKAHYTNAGIKENGTFSINLPPTDLLVVTDYCGIVSGKKVDKSEIFEVFYGALRTAPMIAECRLSMECKLRQTLDFGVHEVFIGEVLETYIDECALTDGRPDISKIDPIIYAHFQNSYWKVGESRGPAFSPGKHYRREK